MITEEQVRRIHRLDGHGLPIVSLYAKVPPERDQAELHTRVNSLLSEVRTMGTDHTIDRAARLSVRSDVERILEYVDSWPVWRPGTLAFFSCSGEGVFEAVSLPRPVRDRVVVDDTPWVRSLVAVLAEYHRVCVVIVERGEASLWELYQDELREIERRRDPKLRHAPPPEDVRLGHRQEELTKKHFRVVADRLDERFQSEGCDLLMVGGPRHELPAFVEQLPRQLRDRLAGTFPVDPDHAGPDWIRQHAGELLAEYTAGEQRQRVTEVAETLAAGGRAALGLPDCLWAAALAAIDSLVVEDGTVRPGTVCDNCGWMTPPEEGLPPECPRCANPVRESADVLDELVERVIEESGSITHVRAATELEKELVGALLRFELPPRP